MSGLFSELLEIPWEDLADRNVTDDELRAAGMPHDIVRELLKQVKVRDRDQEPDADFALGHNRPWNGQEVLEAAVLSGKVSSDIRRWPYQVAVNGLTQGGWVVVGTAFEGTIRMHPGLRPIFSALRDANLELTALAAARPDLAEVNELAVPGLRLFYFLLRNFRMPFRHFPPPERQLVARGWVNLLKGTVAGLATDVDAFIARHRLMAELQMMDGPEEVISAVAADILSGEERYRVLGTRFLAEICGVEPGVGASESASYLPWRPLEELGGFRMHWFRLKPHVSPSRFSALERLSRESGESSGAEGRRSLRPKERQALEILANLAALGGRACPRLHIHRLRDRLGGELVFHFLIGEGGAILSESGPYGFEAVPGIPLDDSGNVRHPDTGLSLRDLRR